MKVKWSVKGTRQLQDRLRSTQVIATKAGKEVAYQEAQEIMRESLEEVPRVTGKLASTAYVEQNGRGEAVFGYGKDDLEVQEYMIAVHERLDVHHPVGKAKFLEDPVNRHAAKIEQLVAEKLSRFFT